MHHCSFKSRLSLLALACCGLMPVFARAAIVDRAEEVRRILRTSLGDLATRDRLLQAQIQVMEHLGDLARTLILREWRDLDQDAKVAAVDRTNRLNLARRFELSVRDILRRGNEASRLAILSMLAEMGTTTHGVGTKHGIARNFGPDLVELGWHGGAEVGAMALRTLGQIDPEPEVALAAFSGPLSGEDANLRLAAADGVVAWIRTLDQLATRSAEPDSVEVNRAEFVNAGRALVPLAARGLGAEQLEVRRRCAQAIGYAATALNTWVLAARSLEASADLDGSARHIEELAPLLAALQDQRSVFRHALVDADGEVRHRVGWILEDVAVPREMLQQSARPSREERKDLPVTTVPPSSFFSISPSAQEREELQLTVRALAVQLSHGDLDARRSALDNLEALGQDAAPALTELVGALGDPDKFVRWAAARTLGKIAVDETVIPRLAQLLTDDDFDVRLAAAAALERLGSVARPAVAELRRTVGSTDPELRLTALRVLGTIGAPEASEAIPEAVAAIRDSDIRVRLMAVQVLGGFGPSAHDAVPALRQALQDSSSEVQKASVAALLNILRPGKE